MPRLIFVVTCVPLFILASSCATRTDVKEAKFDIIVNDNSNREALSNEHKHILQGDLEGLNKQIEAMRRADGELEARLRAEVEASRKQVVDIESIVNAAVGGAAAITSGNVAGIVGNGLRMTEAISERTTRTMVEEASRKTDEAMNAKIGVVRSDVAERTQRIETSVTKLESKLEAIDPALRAELVRIREPIAEEIKALQASSSGAITRESLEQLLQARGLSPDMIQQLKGVSTTELVAWLLGTGALAAGGGGAVSRFGKSRSAPELAKIEQSLTDLRADHEKHEEWLDRTEERLDKLESTGEAKNE